jgi:tetratricopeptide (TPR) repeat protein
VLTKRLLYFFIGVATLTSCSTKKNTVVSRAYHNVTARYNGYYYSGENIDEGVYKIEKANKDNFEKTLPIYIYPTPEKAKSTFPEFDKAIKKSSFCIQRHTIKDKKGNEAPDAGKWIDNNWINIGISQFYKREFFSAVESFEYVTRTYTKSKDKYVAMLWLIKTYNEIGSVSSAEPIISFLKNEKNLPRSVRKELPVASADYYMRRSLNTEASTKLMEVTRNTNPFTGVRKNSRARYSFIAAQLFEQNKDPKRAVEYYKKTIKLKPSTYELIFYSKIRMARLLDVKRNSSEKTKKDLLKMSKEFKNSDYYDVIYYTLGEIEQKERNQTQALFYYKKSILASVSNPSQKALSYLKVGEINFDLTNYTFAAAYYDSAIVTLPKDHPEYKSIVARKKTLEALVGYIKTITKEDSLQRIAKMSEAEINALIDKIILAKQKEEELKQKQKEAEAAKSNGAAGSISQVGQPSQDIPFGQGSVSFYFYNPNVVAFGIADFIKKWGNRKLEDNWRRSNKSISIETLNDSEKDNNGAATLSTDKTKSILESRDSYKKNIPFTDSSIAKSNSRIIKAYYMMGSIYKEELNNTKKTITSFEELNTRFPSNKYLLNTYYTLYRIYLEAKNQPKADYYKEKILNEFPDSEFALLIKNPNYAEELNGQKSEVENFYTGVYTSYHESNYTQSLALAREGISKFGKNDYLPKFEFIKSLSLGKVKGIDSMELSLKLLAAKFPTAEVTPQANAILESIKKQKNPEPTPPAKDEKQVKEDAYVINFDHEHYLIAVLPDQVKMVDGFKSNLNAFNSTYYVDKKFELSSNLFGADKQLVILKSFANAKDAVSYYENLIKDVDVFKGEVIKEQITISPIHTDNLPPFYKAKNVADYKKFFEDNYKNFDIK